MRSNKPKDWMKLVGYDRDGKIVHEQLMSLHEYYEELHPVIDEDAFRKQRGILKLAGTKYDDAGDVEEQWENYYTGTGAISVGIVRDKHGQFVRENKF